MSKTQATFQMLASPPNWYEVAKQLRDQAEVLRSQDTSLITFTNGNGQRTTRSYYNRGVFLMAGFSLENIIKAFLIYEHPQRIKHGHLAKEIRVHDPQVMGYECACSLQCMARIRVERSGRPWVGTLSDASCRAALPESHGESTSAAPFARSDTLKSPGSQPKYAIPHNTHHEHSHHEDIDPIDPGVLGYDRTDGLARRSDPSQPDEGQ